MEKKKQESAEKTKKSSPYISKRSQKLAERYALKSSFSPKSFETPTMEKVKRPSSDVKVINVEYHKKHEFLLDCLKK